MMVFSHWPDSFSVRKSLPKASSNWEIMPKYRATMGA